SSMRLLFLLLSVFSIVHSLQILVYSLAIAHSHLDFASTLIRKLEGKGHTIDLIIVRFNNALTSNGTHNARTILNVGFPNGRGTWSNQPHITRPFTQLPGDDFYATTMALGFFKLANAMCHHVLTDPSIFSHLYSHSYDLALVSNYDGCPLALAHRHGIKRIIGYSSFPVGSPEYVRYFNGLPDLPIYISDTIHRFEKFDIFNIFDRLRNFARNVHMMSNRVEVFRGMVRLSFVVVFIEYIQNEVIRKHYGPDFPGVYEMGREMFYEMANSHPLLEEPKPTSLRIKYIGGIGFKPAKNITSEYSSILSSSSRVILISFGSQVTADAFPPHIIDSFIHTAKSLPDFTFIWRYTKPLHGIPPNLHIVDWLPQNDLLQSPTVAAFVSHCGMNSFVESSFAGVPLLAIPLFADQVHNAYNAERLGMGVILRKNAITRESMVEKMKEVVLNEKYLIRAREIASMLSLYPDDPSDVFIETVEFAAKANRLGEQFRLPGGDLYVWEHLGYDIVILLYTFALFVIYASYKIVRCVLSKVSLRKVKSD
ncbi:hypothetical protein PENTCL1PPCAC_14130, partial [Pristionchus entomophagus]